MYNFLFNSSFFSLASKIGAEILFCIGTVADMAPLLGANRKWLKECLPKIKSTENMGIKAIIQKLSIYILVFF